MLLTGAPAIAAGLYVNLLGNAATILIGPRSGRGLRFDVCSLLTLRRSGSQTLPCRVGYNLMFVFAPSRQGSQAPSWSDAPSLKYWNNSFVLNPLVGGSSHGVLIVLPLPSPKHHRHPEEKKEPLEGFSSGATSSVTGRVTCLSTNSG